MSKKKKNMNIIQDKNMNVILLSLSRDLNTTQDWQPAELTRWCISIANKYEMDEGAVVSHPQIFKDKHLQCALVLKGICVQAVCFLYMMD